MPVLDYCESWFWKRRKTNNPISESEARERHEKREEYTVAVGGFEKPSAIVEVINDFVAVSFMDRLLREYITLKFQEREPNRLFMSMATHRVFCDATDAMVARLEAGRKNPDQPWGQFLADIDWVLDGRTVVFREDGTTFHRAGRHGDPRLLAKPGPPCDVSDNWEPYPEFGKYDHLLKPREIAWGPGIDEV